MAVVAPGVFVVPVTPFVTAAAVVAAAAEVVIESTDAARVAVVEASELVAAFAPAAVVAELATEAALLVDDTDVLSAALVLASAVVEVMAATTAVEANELVLDCPVTDASEEASCSRGSSS